MLKIQVSPSGEISIELHDHAGIVATKKSRPAISEPDKPENEQTSVKAGKKKKKGFPIHGQAKCGKCGKLDAWHKMPKKNDGKRYCADCL